MNMKVITVMFLLVFLLVTTTGCSDSPPVPYTPEALNKLNFAAEKIGSIISPVGSSEEDTAKYLVEYYRKLFKKAGYDLDKSIIKLTKDMEKDPAFFNNPVVRSQTPVLFFEVIIEQINDVRKTVNINKLFSQETLASLDKIVADKRKQVEDAEKAKIGKEEEIRKKKD